MEQKTGRFHVYQEPSEDHNLRNKKLIAREHIRNKNRWIRPDDREALTGPEGRDMTEAEAGEALFGDAVKQYNQKQKRADRKKTVAGYLDEVRADTRGRTNKAIAAANKRAKEAGRVQDVRKEKGKHVAHEVVMSLGRVGDDVPPDVARKIYQEYLDDFQVRNPNFYLFRADYHTGEYFRSKHGIDITAIGGPPGLWSKGVDHLHLNFIPWADGFKQGLSRQVSSGKALAAMGCDGWAEWEAREMEHLAEIARRYEYEIVPAAEKGDKVRGTAFGTVEYQQLMDDRAEADAVKAEADTRLAAVINQEIDSAKWALYVEAQTEALDERRAALDAQAKDQEQQQRKLERDQLALDERRAALDAQAEDQKQQQRRLNRDRLAVDVERGRLKDEREALAVDRRQLEDERRGTLEDAREMTRAAAEKAKFQMDMCAAIVDRYRGLIETEEARRQLAELDARREEMAAEARAVLNVTEAKAEDQRGPSL